MFRVYIKTDEKGRITDINSNAFIEDLTGWIEIDRGEELKHLHAQNNYLRKPVRNEYGAFNFTYKDGKIEEIPEEEVSAEVEKILGLIPQSAVERLKKLEEAITKLLKLFGQEVK